MSILFGFFTYLKILFLQEKPAIRLRLSHRRGWRSSSLTRKVSGQSHPPSRLFCSGSPRSMLHSKQRPYILLVLHKGLVQQHQHLHQQIKHYHVPVRWGHDGDVSDVCQELSPLSPKRRVMMKMISSLPPKLLW